MEWLAGGALGLGGLIGLYLFLIAPNPQGRRRCPNWFRGYFAHRGLHGADAPENSLPAFRRAAEMGFGVELDVRLTLDGGLAVHHDDSLLRTCGVDRLISETPLSEVTACRLMGTGETVPAFEDVLRAIGGRVPMIVELKTAGKRNGELAEKVCRLLAPLGDSVCVESFDPRLVRWFKKRAPHMFRGQLAWDPAARGERRGVGYKVGAHLLMHALSRPDFVAYDQETDRNVSLRLTRRLFRPPMAAWTVRSAERSNALRGRYDAQIFEGFLPERQ